MKCDKYFLGGASPNGFKTHFDVLISDNDFYTYILKGGPGNGKSSLMRKISEAFPDEEKELYFCSSDPDSLDAIVLKSSKVILVDGTAPHTFDAEFPGAMQRIIDLGQFWDTTRLRSKRDEIIDTTKSCKQCHERCRRYITAMAAIISDTINTSASALNLEKLNDFTQRLSKKLFSKHSDSDIKGKITFKQMSALTPKGYITHIPENDTIYLLNDNFYTGSDIFLRNLAQNLTEKGYDIEISISTITNESCFEHLRIPELEISFISSTPINNISLSSKKPINFHRFYDKKTIRFKNTRLKFNASAVKNLLFEASHSLITAKETHDVLEKFYIESLSFDGITRLSYSLISEIKSF